MSGILHLDPQGLPALLVLPERELRVILAILSLAPDGDLLANEGRLAKRAGLVGTRELHEILERLATGATTKGHPMVARDTVRKQPRVKVIGPAGLLVSHPVKAPAPRKTTPATPKPTVNADGLAEGITRRKEAVRNEYGPNLADLTEEWIAHLASLAPGHQLPGQVAVLQWDAVAELSAKYGVEAGLAALRAGMAGVKELGKRPDQYLRSVARSTYVETPTGGRRRRAVPESAPGEEFPL